MRKFYSVIKWFVFIAFSLDLFAGGGQSKKVQKLRFTPSQENLISDLSRKSGDKFLSKDVVACFSAFVHGVNDENISLQEKCKKCLEQVDFILLNPAYTEALDKMENGFTFYELMQSILQNLLIFYMQSFCSNLSAGEFYDLYHGDLSGFVAELEPLSVERDFQYVKSLRENFCTFLCKSKRLERSTLEECQSLLKNVTSESCKQLLQRKITEKQEALNYLHEKSYLKGWNPKLLKSAEGEIFSVFDRLLYLHTKTELNFFKFLSVNKNEELLLNLGVDQDVPYLEMNCFLSLESSKIDVAALTAYLYEGKGYLINKNEVVNVDLFQQDNDVHRKNICWEKTKSLLALNPCATVSGVNTKALLVDLLEGDQLDADRDIEIDGFTPLDVNNGKYERALIKSNSEISDRVPFRSLTWEDCFCVELNSVQHVLANNSLEGNGLGDKHLLIIDRIHSNVNSQKLILKLHVYPSNSLLHKALQNFVAEQDRQYPEPMFLDYNKKKECFELLDVAQYQSQKKVIYGKLDRSYGVLKERSENLVNQVKIDELMEELLKQRESDTEELDMAMVQEVEALLENEEEIMKLTLAMKEICEDRGKAIKAFVEMQSELKEKVEGLKELRQKVNSLNRKEDSKVDLEEGFENLRQAHTELENHYDRLQESSKDSELSKSESWDRLQAQSRKNAEDWEAFQHQEAEHEHAWQLYKEQIRIAQEEEFRRQQEEEQRKAQEEAERKAKEEAEQKRKAEEERKCKEEEQRQLAEQQRLERERLEREEAERRRIEAEEQRRREEEARKPNGFTGQQIVDYAVQHSTPKKAAIAKRLIRINKITPSQFYTNRNQVPPKLQPDFDKLMSEQN